MDYLVYSVILGRYDNVKTRVGDGQWLLYTSDTEHETKIDGLSKGWKVVTISPELLSIFGTYKISRIAKMIPGALSLGIEAQYMVYIDGSIQMQVDPAELVKVLDSNGADIAFFKHTHRQKLGEEIAVVKDAGLMSAEEVRKFEMNVYSRYNPRLIYNLPLYAGGAFVYRMNDKTEYFLNRWNYYVTNFGGRDQIWLPIALLESKKTGLSYSLLPGTIFDNVFLEVMPHQYS